MKENPYETRANIKSWRTVLVLPVVISITTWPPMMNVARIQSKYKTVFRWLHGSLHQIKEKSTS